MELIRHIESHPRRFAAPVVTLGNFDGVHRGHQTILHRVVAEASARRTDAVAITFHPHPVAVLRPDRAPSALTPAREKVRWIAATGVDVLVLRHFTRAFAAIEAEAFVERFLVARLGVGRLIVGHSVSFGHGRRGNTELLEALGERFGFTVEVVGPVEVAGHVVSSSLIRRVVEAGDVRLATMLLGRPHALIGRVVAGKRRGAALGFPTANVHVRVGLHPPDGVYAVRVEIDGRRARERARLRGDPLRGRRQHRTQPDVRRQRAYRRGPPFRLRRRPLRPALPRRVRRALAGRDRVSDRRCAGRADPARRRGGARGPRARPRRAERRLLSERRARR